MGMRGWGSIGSIYNRNTKHKVVSINRGEWVRIENFVKVNTPGEFNGVIRGWVNGELVFEKTDLIFREEGFEKNNIQEIMWHIYHSGTLPLYLRLSISIFVILIFGLEVQGG